MESAKLELELGRGDETLATIAHAPPDRYIADVDAESEAIALPFPIPPEISRNLVQYFVTWTIRV